MKGLLISIIFCFFNSEVKLEIIRIIERKLLVRNLNRRGRFKSNRSDAEKSNSYLSNRIDQTFSSRNLQTNTNNFSIASSARESSALFVHRQMDSIKSHELETLFVANNLMNRSSISQLSNENNSFSYTDEKGSRKNNNKTHHFNGFFTNKKKKETGHKSPIFSRGNTHRLKRNSSTPSLSTMSSKRDSSLVRQISFDHKYLNVNSYNQIIIESQ